MEKRVCVIQTDFHQYRPTIALHSRSLALVRTFSISHASFVLSVHSCFTQMPNVFFSCLCSPSECGPSSLRTKSCLFPSRGRQCVSDFCMWRLQSNYRAVCSISGFLGNVEMIVLLEILQHKVSRFVRV